MVILGSVRRPDTRPRRRTLALAAAVAAAAAIAVGAVLVATGGGDGASPERVLQTAFHPPQPFQLDDVFRDRAFTCGARDGDCVLAYLLGITDEYGPRASLPILKRLQDEGRVDLSLNDHALAHAVGRETAKDFGSNFESFDLCPTTFNYGCPHGFFEYVLARTDTPKEAAASVCETASGQGNRLLTSGFSCYHGVGHGVMMAEAYDLNGALDTCNTLGTPQAAEGCWQGVFMENVNAGMAGTARKGVFLRARPLAPCDGVEQRYRHQCFINQAGWLMTVAANKVERATGYCMRAQGPDRTACMQSLGLMVTNPVWQATLAPDARSKPQSTVAWELCGRFPEGGRRDCVLAGIDNLANFDQLDVARESAFCAVVADVLKQSCYRQIGVNLRARTPKQAIVRSRCGSLGVNGRLCLGGAGLGS